MYLRTAGLILGMLLGSGAANQAFASFIVTEGEGANAAAITAVRDAFRAAVGGGTVAGANGDFGGLRKEINWDGVPDASADPFLLAPDFFNTTSPRGAVFSTPGSGGFLVSANSGQSASPLFGFPSDFVAFSPQRLFTALNSNIIDVLFFIPGTSQHATTSAFGLVFVDVEVAGSTKLDFYDSNNNLIFSRDALVAGNQGFSFLGAVANSGERIARVRITSGTNTIAQNAVLGDPNSDVVVMDDMLFAAPLAAVPEPGSMVLFGFGLAALGLVRKSVRR